MRTKGGALGDHTRGNNVMTDPGILMRVPVARVKLLTADVVASLPALGLIAIGRVKHRDPFVLDVLGRIQR